MKGRICMKYKIGGGGHLQPYDKEDGQYTDKDKAEIAKKDMENLMMVYLFGFDYSELRFHFPKMGIHDDDYCDYFVRYVKDNHLYGEPFMEETKLSKYLFYQRSVSDKSKYMIEVLGFENGPNGWNKARLAIIDGMDLETMKYTAPFLNDCLEVSVESSVYDSDGIKHDIITIWQLKDNLILRFITLKPRRK